MWWTDMILFVALLLQNEHGIAYYFKFVVIDYNVNAVN